MRQATFASAGFERYGKTTRRAAFLTEMDQVVPWPVLCALIEPVYPKPGNGRPPIGLERMLRIYFLQHWFNLSDPGVEEALYESLSMRRFAGIDLGRAGAGRDDSLQVPPPAGAARPRAGVVRAGACAPPSPRPRGEHRHDRRCDHHPGAQFDQERGAGA